MNGPRLKDIDWGYGQMDPVWSLLLMLRPWMGYDYTVYTYCMLGRAPRTKVTLPNFHKNLNPYKWDITMW